ncbi:MAG: MBL fold metallo-hydrolase [Oscillospiraceae bacterium]|nr:MBL fold metallo-hydrolase [Oscillospiraceae bacterium]
MARKKKKNAINNKSILSIIVIIALIIFGYLYKDEIGDFVSDILENNNIDLSGKLAVHYIDVGQGDSILIQSPENEFILIDTGEKDQYEKLNSYLEHYNITKFKYVIFTHPHSDHIGSADKIVKNYDIENIIMPEVYHNTKTYEKLLTEIENKNLEINAAIPGKTFKFGGAEFIILAPNSDSYKSLNNYSVVIKLTYGNTNFLFTGDMEKESENEVITYCKNNNIDLSIDILKVAHHGSSTSSQTNFIKLLNPKYAVIMCGIDNSYNHPNLKVVDRIESNGAEILRTDLDRDIIIISDGNVVSIAQKGRGTIIDYSTEKSSGDLEDYEYETEKNEDFIEEK